jgi:(2R)-3-sulfolactate dehydrogenase (NADP+)
MADPVRLTLSEAQALAERAFVASGLGPAQAASVARALVAAEADGQVGHGLSRVPSYALHARCGKADGRAQPVAEQVAPSALRVDAQGGFAYPAIDLALEQLMPLAQTQGLALAAVHHSHHFGQAGAHAERLAQAGLIGLVLGNTPQAMAFWGGKAPRLGTNPIAFACPLPNGATPLVIDMALSTVARGKIMAAQKAGKPIPAGWALDANGNPTTDPAAALKGSMLPIGDAKGAALALMVEILAAALTGGSFGWEASSFFDDQGGPPAMGHVFVAIDPDRVSGGAFMARMGTLLEAIADEPSVRLPGSRRLAARAAANRDGVSIPAALHAEILTLVS